VPIERYRTSPAPVHKLKTADLLRPRFHSPFYASHIQEQKQRRLEPFSSCVDEIWDIRWRPTQSCLHDYQRSRRTVVECPLFQRHWCHSCFHSCTLEVLPFWQRCQITLERTTSAFDAVVVHPRGKEKHQVVVIRAKSSMEKYLQDFKVVRRHRRLYTEKEDLRTSESPAIMWLFEGI
jgi:hypothetical protein